MGAHALAPTERHTRAPRRAGAPAAFLSHPGAIPPTVSIVHREPAALDCEFEARAVLGRAAAVAEKKRLVDFLDVDAALNRLNDVRDLEDPARGFFWVGEGGGRWCISCGGLVFLVRAAGNDPDRVVRQRPLQRLGLVPWRTHPDVAFLVRHQDDRHGLRVDRLDHGVRRRGKKAVDLMRAGDRFRFRPSVALELGPDTGEAGQRPIVIDREPDDVLFLGHGVRLRRVFSETVERHQAAVFRFEPAASCGPRRTRSRSVTPSSAICCKLWFDARR